MQGDQQNFPQNQGQNDPYSSSFLGQNVDFQPSRDCPRNYIIFDRTDNHSQIMYNPSLNMGAPYFPDLMQKDGNAPRVMQEDLADIDALLSFENEDDDEEYEDEEEISTARTEEDDTNDTFDSRFGSTSGCESKGNLGKREKMKKMMKSLRGIVPGGNQKMKTADVLDEAVKYLKSLKVEAQKKGFGNSSGGGK